MVRKGQLKLVLLSEHLCTDAQKEKPTSPNNMLRLADFTKRNIGPWLLCWCRILKGKHLQPHVERAAFRRLEVLQENTVPKTWNAKNNATTKNTSALHKTTILPRNLECKTKHEKPAKVRPRPSRSRLRSRSFVRPCPPWLRRTAPSTTAPARSSRRRSPPAARLTPAAAHGASDRRWGVGRPKVQSGPALSIKRALKKAT